MDGNGKAVSGEILHDRPPDAPCASSYQNGLSRPHLATQQVQ